MFSKRAAKWHLVLQHHIFVVDAWVDTISGGFFFGCPLLAVVTPLLPLALPVLPLLFPSPVLIVLLPLPKELGCAYMLWWDNHGVLVATSTIFLVFLNFQLLFNGGGCSIALPFFGHFLLLCPTLLQMPHVIWRPCLESFPGYFRMISKTKFIFNPKILLYNSF